MSESQFPDLIEMGRHAFERFRAEFASYGIETDPQMELRKGAGMLCYYDFNDRHIYLSMPDLNAPTGKLQLLMFRQMLSAGSNEELMRFLAIFIPFVVAHEMTHHFRHRYALFGKDSWKEEQLANMMASAVNKHRIPPGEREFAVMFLQRAMKKLAEQLGIGEDAFDTYYDIANALQTSDHLSDEELDAFRMTQEIAPDSMSATMMLRRSRAFSDDINQRLKNRRELIASFNLQYAGDQARYIYYQVGWVYLAMKSEEASYVEEFKYNHLGMSPTYLNIQPLQKFNERAIHACFKASEQTRSKATISRYFYKRYRAILIEYLRKAYSIIAQGGRDAPAVNFDFLAIWDDRAKDPLDFLAGMAPPILRETFPAYIGRSPLLPGIKLPSDLPTEEDRQIWEAASGAQAGAAADTVELLCKFDNLEHFRALPAESILELAKYFFHVRLDAGETLLWEGETNGDVFVLLDGKLETASREHGTTSLLEPGAVFGEIAWLTNGSRIATVRALVPSTCLVIKDSDLQLLSYKNSSILMSIARTLARRFRSLPRP